MAAACSIRPSFLPLIQIRKGYTARWTDVNFSIQNDLGLWTLEVRQPGEPLYRAHRSSVKAAQAAAVDYALFHSGGAPQMVWAESW